MALAHWGQHPCAARATPSSRVQASWELGLRDPSDQVTLRPVRGGSVGFGVCVTLKCRASATLGLIQGSRGGGPASPPPLQMPTGRAILPQPRSPSSHLPSHLLQHPSPPPPSPVASSAALDSGRKHLGAWCRERQ